MPLTRSQKAVGIAMSLVVYVGLSFPMTFAIGWLASYMPHSKTWFVLGFIATFGVIAGYGLSLCFVSEFKDRFARFYTLIVMLSICGGWIAGINTAVRWYHPPQIAELAPYVTVISVVASCIACAILHRFKPNMLPLVSE